MGTSRVSSKTRKAMKRAGNVRRLRHKSAMFMFERRVKANALLKKLQKVKDLSARDFYAQVPVWLVRDAIVAFDRLGPARQARYSGTYKDGVWEISFDRSVRLKKFMLTDYLKYHQLNESTKRLVVNEELNHPLHGYPKRLVLREQFTRDFMNNFHMNFMDWGANSPHNFNRRFSKYGVSTELLKSRFPNLMKRLEGYSRNTDFNWGIYSKKQLVDFYKIYKVLRSEFKISNKQLCA